MDELINILKNEKFKFNQEIYFNETKYILKTNDELYINVVNDRILSHFSYDASFAIKYFYNIYTIKNNDLYINVVKKILLLENLTWNSVYHMGGYYYNVKICDKYRLVLWVTNNHSEFGNINYSIDNIIKDYFSMNKNVCCIITNDKNYIYIYNDVNPYTTLVPMRLIRALICQFFYSINSIYFHCAAVMYKGRAILLTGASGSGKTSTLLHILNNKDVKIISNDKAFILKNKNQKIMVYGWPTVATLGVGNLKQYDKLKKYLTNIEDILCLQDLYNYIPSSKFLSMSEDQLKNLKKEGNKLVMSHKNLADIFKKDIIGKCEIGAIINLKLNWNCSKKKLIEISGKDKKSIFLNNVIQNLSDKINWLGIENDDHKSVDDDFLNQIIDKVKFYDYYADFKDDNLSSFIDEVI